MIFGVALGTKVDVVFPDEAATNDNNSNGDGRTDAGLTRPSHEPTADVGAGNSDDVDDVSDDKSAYEFYR